MLKSSRVLWIVLAVVIAGVLWFWIGSEKDLSSEGFVSSNGRIEATEIDLATKFPGRIEEILVEEGDFVEEGQILAIMQLDSLEAQLREAEAHKRQAINSVASARAQVAMRESDKLSMQAQVKKAEAELVAAQQRLDRSRKLSAEGATSKQNIEDDLVRKLSAEAGIAASKAQVATADAAILAAEAQVSSALSQVEAIEATLERIAADIEDSKLKAPKTGRVQFLTAQKGEVLGAGGRVLNLVDLSDVYMNFFLPTELVGTIPLGSEARVILDAAPHFPIPAHISYVASTAQFTPKTVETYDERQKLMFRVKAKIDRELLQKYIEQVKTGLPGEVWLRTDTTKSWPAELEFKAN